MPAQARVQQDQREARSLLVAGNPGASGSALAASLSSAIRDLIDRPVGQRYRQDADRRKETRCRIPLRKAPQARLHPRKG
jgi:hypothetical protein